MDILGSLFAYTRLLYGAGAYGGGTFSKLPSNPVSGNSPAMREHIRIHAMADPGDRAVEVAGRAALGEVLDIRSPHGFNSFNGCHIAFCQDEAFPVSPTLRKMSVESFFGFVCFLARYEMLKLDRERKKNSKLLCSGIGVLGSPNFVVSSAVSIDQGYPHPV